MGILPTTYRFTFLRSILIGCCLLMGFLAVGQTTRILFVLDASGSMTGDWNGEQKMVTAKNILKEAIDSLSQAHENVEIGLRVFGHQSPREAYNCKDSRLEVKFGRNNAAEIKMALSRLTPQGHTPIAYSLYQALGDFPSDPGARNVIILITDGLETCEGDPCALAPLLQQNNITLRPFIIGLGMGQESANYFDCVGIYYDAANSREYQRVLDIIISQATHATTAQINLLGPGGIPNETNIPVSLYDAYTNEIEEAYIHAIPQFAHADTLYLTPVIPYDMVVHTTPPVTVDSQLLIPGKHNILAASVPQGTLTLKIDGYSRLPEGHAIIRKSGQLDIVDVQQLNTRNRLLADVYNIEILTLPRIVHKEIAIKANEELVINVPEAGQLQLNVAREGIASIYTLENGQMNRIFEYKNISGSVTLSLLPGQYWVVYRQYPFKRAELTKAKPFTIYSRSTTPITF